MGAWLIFVQVLLPIPFTILLVLSLPVPALIRKYILKFTDAVIFLKIWGQITVYQLLVAISTILFGLSLMDTVSSKNRESHADNLQLREREKCVRWRNERNFWITSLSLVLWIILFRVRALVNEVTNLRRAVATENRE